MLITRPPDDCRCAPRRCLDRSALGARRRRRRAHNRRHLPVSTAEPGDRRARRTELRRLPARRIGRGGSTRPRDLGAGRPRRDAKGLDARPLLPRVLRPVRSAPGLARRDVCGVGLAGDRDGRRLMALRVRRRRRPTRRKPRRRRRALGEADGRRRARRQVGRPRQAGSDRDRVPRAARRSGSGACFSALGRRRVGRMRRLAFLLLTVAALVGPASSPAAAKPALPCDDLKGLKDYPGDDAPRAAIAQWMAYYAIKASLPAELPVMAALEESGLQNLQYGDADSIGYFQMRTSIWDNGLYAGFPTNPQLQAKWFIDHALLARQQRLAAGLDVSEASYGEWIADVERPPENERYRYQLRLGETRNLLCPCSPKAVKDYPGDDAPRAVIAQWMAYYAIKASLPPELPVMAALEESGLQNLQYGDADSLGYFQMRTGIWDSGPYAGFPANPQLQLKWFVDQALLARERRLAAGLDISEGAWGEWIADVERPPEAYRYRYQLRLGEARA